MKPKEKAVELFDKMYENQSTSTLSRNVSSFKQAKQCALIAVDEILNNGLVEPQLKRHYLQGLTPKITELEYWQQVKAEIENL